MSIEDKIQNLIDALDRATAAFTAVVTVASNPNTPGAAPAEKPVKAAKPAKPAKEEPKQEAKQAPTVSKEQIGKAIAAALAANQREGVVATLKQFGASNASTVQEDDYEAVLEALNSLLLAN